MASFSFIVFSLLGQLKLHFNLQSNNAKVKFLWGGFFVGERVASNEINVGI